MSIQKEGLVFFATESVSLLCVNNQNFFDVVERYSIAFYKFIFS